MDPLKSINDLARLLWSKTERRATSSHDGSSKPSLNPSTDAATVIPTRSLEEQLKRRLSRLPNRNAKTAREVFVETVLLSQLGEDIGRDTLFVEMKTRVAEQLAANPALCSKLDELLKGIIDDNEISKANID